MKPNAFTRSLLLALGNSLLAISSASAQDGTWTPTTAGPFNWGDSGNWSDGTVASGVNNTAFFTSDINPAQTVNLDAARTIGNITFTDATSSHNLTISGANILTLDRTTGLPVIDVTQSGRTLTINSEVAGTDGLQKDGLGNLGLGGANSFTGGITLTAGTLRLETTGSLVSSNNLTFDGTATFNSFRAADGSQTLGTLDLNRGDATITSTAAGASSAATLTFGSLDRASGTTVNFTLGTNTTASTNKIVFTNTAGLPLADGSNNAAIFFGGSAYARYDADGYMRAVVYGTDDNTNAELSGNVATLGTITGTIDARFNGAATTASTASAQGAASTLTVANGGLFNVGQAITGAGITANTYITGISGNILTLNQNTGTVNANAAITPHTLITAQTTGSANTLNLSGAGASLRLADDQTLSINGILRSGGTANVTSAISGGTGIRTVTSGGELVVRTDAANDHMTIASVISDHGGSSLTKSGAGTLLLTGNNTFTGNVTVNEGTLTLGGTNSFADITVNGSTLALNGAIVGSGMLGAAGGNLIFTGVSSFTPQRDSNAIYNKNVSISGTTTFGMSTQFFHQNFSGVLSGDGTIIKNDSNGILTFSNASNTFTGAIRLDGGTGGMAVSSLADSANSIQFNGNTGTLNFVGGALTSTSLLFDNRQIVLAHNNGGAIANNNTDSNKTVTINTDLGFANTGARTLTLTGTNGGLNTFGGNIQNNGASATSLIKSGNGSWILSNTANSYTGGTTVSAGTLQAGASNVLAAGPVTVTGGTLDLGAFNHTLGVLTQSGGTINGSGTITANRFVLSSGTPDWVLAGTGDLYKSGTGTLTLNVAQSFSGGTTVAGGTLTMGASGTLGPNTVGNSITIANDGVLRLSAAANSGSNQGITLASSSNTGVPILSGGAGPVGRLSVLALGFNGLPDGAISQANTLGGVIAINAVTGYDTDLSSVLTGKNLFLGAIGTSTFTGAAGTVVAGNGSLYRLGGGGGQITFNTENLFTGASGVQVGSTFANGGGTVVVSAAQDYTGATTVNAGTLTLSGADGTATGSSGFTLNGGRLLLDSVGADNNNTNRIGNVNVSLRNGGELSLSGNASGTTEAFGDLNLGAGYSTVTATAVTAASTLAGTGFSRTNNGTALFRGTALGQNTTVMGQVTLSDTTGLSFVGATTLNDAANGDTTKDVRIIPYLIGATAAGGTGDTFVTYDTTHGFRVLNTTNQFNTTVTAGNNIRLTAAQTGIATNSINSLIIANTGSSTIANSATLTVSSGAVLFSSGGTIAPVSSGTGILAFGAAEGIVTTVANGTISARITGSGGLTKSGAGQLTLSNASNSYTGGTLLNGGTLATTADGNLGGAGGVTVNANATWSMGGAVVTYARNLTINEGATLTLASGNNAKTVSGVLSGNGTLFANHFTNFIFSNAANTFTGEIVSNTANNTGYGLGFASIGDTAGAGLINLVGNQGTFRWLSESGSTTTLANRQFAISSPGQATISALGTTDSNLVINKDLLITGEAGARSLRLAGTNLNDNTFAGKITDDGFSVVSLNKAEASKWILSNANTFSGTTLVSAGTLELTNSLALQNSPLDALNSVTGAAAAGLRTTVTTLTIGGLSGTKNLSTLFTTTTGGYSGLTGLTLNPVADVTTSYSGVIGNGAAGMSLTKTGAGTQILSGANTYTGATNVNAGTLEIGLGGSTHASSGVSVSNSGSALVVNGTVNGTLNANVSTTVSGSGTVVGAATIFGNLTPGNSAGLLNFGSDLTMASTTSTTMEIAGMTIGVGYDSIAAAGALTYDGILTLAIGATFGSDAVFNLFDFGSQSGSFESVALTGNYTGTLVNNGFGVWSTSTNSGAETWSFSQSTGDLSLTVIPEPNVAALIGALGTLLLLRRRR
jgi:fibronectin-binding autotransporter adhesin